MADAARWEQGRASIDGLVAEGRLQVVQPDRELARAADDARVLTDR